MDNNIHPSHSQSPKIRVNHNLKELYGFALNSEKIIKNIGYDEYIDYIYGFYKKCLADLDLMEDS